MQIFHQLQTEKYRSVVPNGPVGPDPGSFLTLYFLLLVTVKINSDVPPTVYAL